MKIELTLEEMAGLLNGFKPLQVEVNAEATEPAEESTPSEETKHNQYKKVCEKCGKTFIAKSGRTKLCPKCKQV